MNEAAKRLESYPDQPSNKEPSAETRAALAEVAMLVRWREREREAEEEPQSSSTGSAVPDGSS